MRKDSLMRMGQTSENAPEDLFPIEDTLKKMLKKE